MNINISLRRVLASLVFLLALLPAVCSAGVMPIIRSDVRTFDIAKGVYNLKGNVFVQWPIKDSEMTITADSTEVCIYDMEVHGQGNIVLAFGPMQFYCDKVDVYHSQRTAFVEGDLRFKDGKLDIRADSGSYCWKTKLASFKGHVKVNGKPHKDVVYHVNEKKFVQQPNAPPKSK